MPPAADTSFPGAPQFHGWRTGVNATGACFNTPANSKTSGSRSSFLWIEVITDLRSVSSTSCRGKWHFPQISIARQLPFSRTGIALEYNADYVITD
jgi:hypothetical protein